MGSMSTQTITEFLEARIEAAEAAHPVDPAWSALYETHKCKACGKWVYQIHGGEWKHGGTK